MQIPIYDVSSEIITNYFYDNKQVSEEEVLENPSQNILRNRCFPATRREKKKKNSLARKGRKLDGWKKPLKEIQVGCSWLKLNFTNGRCG